jgi:hypothetical protein
MKLRNKVLGLVAILALVALAPAANATLIYNLTVDNCTGGCNPNPPASMGTVQLDQSGSGNVLVTVTLVSPLWFVNSGLQNTIDFNLAGIASGVTANTFSNANFSLTSGTAGALHFDGFGDFQYSIQLNTAQGAGGAVNASPLTFHILATGLTEASFVANSQGSIFGVDVYNTVNGNTGPIGTTGSTVTPEPISSALVGTGLISLFFLRKRASRKA